MQSNIRKPRRSSISGIDIDTQMELNGVPVMSAERVSAFQINQASLMVPGLADISDSNSSMESEENNDFVSPMAGEVVEWTNFRQIDYLWLFDPILKFSERAEMELEESSLSTEDYEKMRRINRQALTDFLKY